MTGSHEVRGSIPLGSTNNINNLQVVFSEGEHLQCLQCAEGFTDQPFLLFYNLAS